MTPAPLDRLEWTEIAARLGAAVVLAAVVGIERELRSRPAGLRTIMLVGLGSATFVLAGYEMLGTLAERTHADPAALSELSRVLQGVIGGIGFLGAGAVIQSGGAVKGLTTAASIWVTAAIGISCGLGLYRLAAICTAVAMFTLVVLGWLEKRAIEPGKESRGEDEGSKKSSEEQDRVQTVARD